MSNYSCSEIRSYNAHQLFTNAYYDFVNDSRWTPYAGVGLGWARTNLDYWSVFVRKPEVEYLQIAFGVQLMTGIDYALTDRASVGAKARWATFGSLSKEAQPSTLFAATFRSRRTASIRSPQPLSSMASHTTR